MTPNQLAQDVVHECYKSQLIGETHDLERKVAWMIRTAINDIMDIERADWQERLKKLENEMGMRKVTSAEDLAKLMHYVYERRAPEFGYETREDTKEWDPETPNGQLMIATIEELMRAGFIAT